MINFRLCPFAARVLILAALLAAFGSAPAAAQPTAAPPAFVQAGGGIFPGGGVQLGYVAPGRFYTVEGVFYASRAPAFEDEGDFFAAVGGGGALRLGETLRILFGSSARYSLDAGVRFGPGLLFRADETPAQRNQRFRLIFDPFVRGTLPLGGGWSVFAEAGAHRPLLRAGFWIPF